MSADAIEILTESAQKRWPASVRIAAALGGTSGFAAAVSRQLLRRARPMCTKWIDSDEADRWFLHHTILRARSTDARETLGKPDALIAAFDKPTTEYVAFIRALRTLSFQQREAFVLSECERLDPRLVAVSMDCSKTAAQQHLLEATQQLTLVAGETYDVQIKRLRGAYQHLSPREDETAKRIQWLGRPIVVKRKIRRVLVTVITIALIAIAAVVAYRVWS